MILKMSDDQIDSSAKKMLRDLPEEPSALQLLQVVDMCIYGALASKFVLKVLQFAYDDQLKVENKTHEEIVKDAAWRKAKPW